jgi:hypothetical protein
MECNHLYWLAKIDNRGEGRGNMFEAGVFYCRKCLDIQRRRLD